MVLPLVENGSLEDYVRYKRLSGASFARVVCGFLPCFIRFTLIVLPQVLGVTRAISYLHSRVVPVLHGDLHWVRDYLFIV